ncbi:hypothetical protein [Nocardia brasiliensis]|uniref:hypothetical protein n=1 Tax=Nocardia brasiliensis TaxID=37326 RepID=UPI003D905484
MTTPSEEDASEEHSPAAASEDLSTAIPEWAPAEPLPSSEMFLATFAGQRPIAGGDILDAAFDLVACHREERLAEAILTDQTSSLEELRVAGQSLVSVRADIAMLVTIIDEAVWERLLRRRRDHLTTPIATPPGCLRDARKVVSKHTESVGDVAARMAELWEAVSYTATDLADRPEAQLLAELCDGYDGLAAEIEAGRRLPAGM